MPVDPFHNQLEGAKKDPDGQHPGTKIARFILGSLWRITFFFLAFWCPRAGAMLGFFLTSFCPGPVTPCGPFFLTFFAQHHLPWPCSNWETSCIHDFSPCFLYRPLSQPTKRCKKRPWRPTPRHQYCSVNSRLLVTHYVCLLGLWTPPRAGAIFGFFLTSFFPGLVTPFGILSATFFGAAPFAVTVVQLLSHRFKLFSQVTAPMWSPIAGLQAGSVSSCIVMPFYLLVGLAGC